MQKRVSTKDIYFMKKALSFARRGLGKTHPNPMVGAVVVKNGRILGSGAHERFGGPHAEVSAIRSARGAVAGATLYVTLEPCPHYGKTPPCTELILKENIRRVVIAAVDPNPLVSGRGISALRKKKIRVSTGVLAEEAETLNKDYNHWVQKKTPYTVLKFAQSLDGKIADTSGRSRWISGKASRALAHGLRAEADAILVGVNTVLKDDPLLSVRSASFRRTQPVKIILDTHLRTPLNARIFSKASLGAVILATGAGETHPKFKALRSKAEMLRLPLKKSRVDLTVLLKVLGKRGIVNLLIEGGSEVIADALEKKVAHEIYCFIAPILLGGKEAPGSVGGLGFGLQKALKLREFRIQRVDEDLLVRAKL